MASRRHTSPDVWQPVAPVMPPDLEEPGDPPDTTVPRYERSRLTGGRWPGGGGSLELEAVELLGVAMGGADLRDARLVDVLARDCDLSTTAAAHATWSRCALLGCRATGIGVEEGRLEDVVFQQCQLSLANFRFARLRRVEFRECSMLDVDFQGATLQQVRLLDCQLGGAQFQDAAMTTVDLRGSEIDGILGLGGLRGATIDSLQLAGLAARLAREAGITVSERGPEPAP